MAADSSSVMSGFQPAEAALGDGAHDDGAGEACEGSAQGGGCGSAGRGWQRVQMVGGPARYAAGRAFATAWETLSTTVEVDGDDMEARVYCALCRVFLNGPPQYADHLKGQKHRRNLRGGQSSIPSTAAPSEADDLAFGHEAHMRMLEGSSRAELAAFGAAARRVQRAWRR